MKDYSLLVEALREHGQSMTAYLAGADYAEVCEEAAAAIEKLVKERDAAVMELDRISDFTESEFLGCLNETIHHECGYEYYIQLFDLLCQVTHYEYEGTWRGKQGGEPDGRT